MRGKHHKGKKRRYRSTKPRMEQTYKNIHHFYHPKRLYRDSENILMLVFKVAQDEYHFFFNHHCKNDPDGRECFRNPCPHEPLCCYCQSTVAYGKRLF